jgi:holo-[acyl-carrier protein] synthase
MESQPIDPPPLVGIDLVDPRELARRLERNPELQNELFWKGEVAYAERQSRPIQHLAARYAAKEAVVKALGLDGFDPLDVEVVGGGERTSLRLRGDADTRSVDLGVTVRISLSHLPGIAAAVAMAIPNGS